MSTILKKLRSLPMLGLVAAAAVLSMAMGCGGADTSNGSQSNAIFLNYSSTEDDGDPDTLESFADSTVGFTIRNNTGKSIAAVGYTDNAGVQTKSMTPHVPNQGTIAVLAKVTIRSVSSGGGTTGSTSTTAIMTPMIYVTVFPEGASSFVVGISLSVGSDGKIEVAGQGTQVLVSQ